ncbi:MAG: ATP-dependent RNA helicase SrmB [Nitrospira sp.]|nr:ATP-dependent RNA helicase SrmB [Nitrospira sp.]
MLVIEKTKSLALKLNNPAQVLSCIPTAKTINFRGTDLVVVPHRPEEVRVLRNLGIKAPAPILHYYPWPGQFTPYNHQRLTSAFLTMNKRCLVLNEIGTGKTQSALWAADYLMKLGVVKKVLIISPLSTLERVWGDAIFKGMIGRQHYVLHGTAARRLKLLKSKADFYIINHDGFSIIQDQCDGMFDLVIVDEAAVLRNPTTTRFKMFRRWLGRNPDTRLWMMTGTPTPNEPTDAWALAQLLGSPYVPNSFTSFREQVMMKIGSYKWVARPGATQTVKELLQPAIRFVRDECFDLPDTVYQTRSVELTPMQEKYYKDMVRTLVVDYAHGISPDARITAVNEAVKLQKLVQISCGVAYDDFGNNIELDCSPRVEAVKEIIDEVGGKVIVFVPLTGTLHMLHKKLSKHRTCAVVNGAVATKARNEIFYNFQENAHPQVLIAHPATMAHGLTLTAASTIIWYGPITSNEQYVQANGRIERIGKRHISNVVHIEGTALENKMYRRLEGKQKLQGLLLELIRENMEI